MPRTGASVCAEILRDAGVRTVFGIPGQRILPFVHELRNGFGIDVVLTRHEQGAAFMADAYARVSGLGCCFGTSGPGATNLLTGSAASYMDSVPMLAITAQAATTEFGKYGIQEGTGLGRTPDIPAMFGATCKASIAPMSADELAPALTDLLSTATGGRPGAVHMDVPSDLFLAAVEVEAAPTPAASAATNGNHELPDDAMRHTMEVLARAKRPLILAGNGVIRSDSCEALMRFAEAADVPVAGSFLAKAVLDERHPLVLGPVGVFGRPEANEALHHEADVVLALGVSFNYMTTAGWTARLGPERLIRIDIDPRELETNYEGGVSVLADVGTFVEALEDHGDDIAGGGRGRVSELRRLAERTGVDEPSRANGALHPVTVCRAVNDYLDDSTAVVADVGQNAYWVERHLRTRGHGRFMINGGLGSMGHGVAGAVGTWAALRDGGRSDHVLATCGDGGFMMGALELSTAASLDANITWLIFNNSTLGTQRAWFEREGHPTVACDLPPIDYTALASSMGVAAERVSDGEGLTHALEQAWETSGPRVIDVEIDPAPAPAPYAP